MKHFLDNINVNVGTNPWNNHIFTK